MKIDSADVSCSGQTIIVKELSFTHLVAIDMKNTKCDYQPTKGYSSSETWLVSMVK